MIRYLTGGLIGTAIYYDPSMIKEQYPEEFNFKGY